MPELLTLLEVLRLPTGVPNTCTVATMTRLAMWDQAEGSGQIKRASLTYLKPVSVAMRVVIYLASAAFVSLSAEIEGKKGTLLMHARA